MTRTTLIAAGFLILSSTVLSAQQPAQVSDKGKAPKFPVCDFYNNSESRNEGRKAATKQRIYPWYGVAAATGTLFPLVNIVVMNVVAFKGVPLPDSIPKEWNPTCYKEGFRVQGRKERGMAAFVGGLAGTAVGLVAVFALHADDNIVFPLVPGSIDKP